MDFGSLPGPPQYSGKTELQKGYKITIEGKDLLPGRVLCRWIIRVK